MKKLYLGFILLLAIFALVYRMNNKNVENKSVQNKTTEQEVALKREIQKELERKDYLLCLYKKKLELPEKYIGPNLKAQVLSNDKRFHGSTGIDYLLGANSSILSNVISKDEDCYEQIVYLIDKDKSEMVGYEVTNVPIYSYLKYVPGTKEMIVFSPIMNDSRKMFITNKVNDINNKAHELEKSITTNNVKLMNNKLQELKTAINRQLPLVEKKMFEEELMQYFVRPEEDVKE